MSGWIGTIVILLIIAAVAVLAARSAFGRAKHGGGCCGEHGCMDKKVRVTDRNRAHYPYAVRLRIDGMTCASCTRRVENTLNRQDGLWVAQIDLQGALVRCKAEPQLQPLRDVIAEAGYTLLRMEPEKS